MSDALLDFRQRRIIKGRGLYVALPLAERLRAARGVPQAVVKIAGFGRGAKSAHRLLAYISRKGKLALETESGDAIENLEDQKSLVKSWSRSFDRRVRSRDLVHLVFSMPRRSPPEALRMAVRSVVTGHLAGHRAAFALHEDKDHPHVHVALLMKNQLHRKKLRLRRADIHRLREAFAAAAREQGVELAASSRAARGVGRKGERRVVRELKKRGIIPKVERHAEQEARRDLQRGKKDMRPWDIAQLKRREVEQAAYREESRKLREVAGKKPPDLRPGLLKAAQELDDFAQRFPMPQTLRDIVRRKLKSTIRAQRGNALRHPDRDSGMER